MTSIPCNFHKKNKKICPIDCEFKLIDEELIYENIDTQSDNSDEELEEGLEIEEYIIFYFIYFVEIRYLV